MSQVTPSQAAWIRGAERVVLAAGLTFVGIWLAARFHRAVASRTATARFQAEEANLSGKSGDQWSPSVDPSLGAKVDFRLWAKNRIAAYEASLTQKKDMPIAILRIPKINLEAPVFDETDELTLNRGVGRIEGTARIGQVGNLGVAGHRDGFFRGLKDIVPGDVIDLEARGRTNRYVVKGTQIVEPEDAEVLKPTATTTLTLVTCFPFYYVGSAPQRYIVTASKENSGQRD